MPATVERRPHHAPDQRAIRTISLRTLVRLGIVAGIAYAAVLAIGSYGRTYVFFDMRIYHGAMVWWANGGELYDYVAPGTTLGYTYPPFAALAMVPMAVLPEIVAGWVNAAASLTALAVVLAWLLGPIADRRGWPRWFVVAVAVPLAAATEPVRETIGFGQVNLLLGLLVYADMVALRNRHRWATDPTSRLVDDPVARLWRSGALAGVGVGLAAAIKLTPALFIWYFVVTRQWRAAFTAIGTAVGVTAATFFIDGRESAAYFGGVLWDTSRVGEVDATANQSLAGVLARLYDSPTTPTLMWIAFAMLALAVGMSRSATAHREGDELTAFTLVGLTTNVISPISWSHHLIYVVPALVILADTALRRRSAARGLSLRGMSVRWPAAIGSFAGLRHALATIGLYVLFVVSPIWRYEHKLPNVSHYADGLHGALAENSLALALIALVALLPWRPGAEPAFYPEPSLGTRVRVRTAARS